MSLRPALVLLTVALAWPFAADARADTYPVGSPVWTAAIEASVAVWGALPCGGAVEYGSTDLPAGVVGYASWMRSGQAPLDASRFTTCRVDFNTEMDLGPEDFCTTLAHEMGHLHGQDHVDDPSNLMAATIGAPPAACVAAMAPLLPAVTAAALPVAEPAAPRVKRKPSAKRRRSARAIRIAKALRIARRASNRG